MCFPLLQVLGGEIYGTVKCDLETVPFVKIWIPSLNQGTVSDINGAYSLKNIPVGNFILTVSATGFETDTLKVKIDSNDTLELNIYLKAHLRDIQEVTITGSLKETRLSDSPVPISVISPKLFEKNPTPSIFESLSMVNGVRPQMQCNVCSTGDIHINGMEGPYTMVMIDGMPIVSALGTVYGLMGIPNSIIERVEIQKGPSSTLYGSEAVGGLINVITKKVDNAPRFSFNLNGSTYQEYLIDMSAKFKIGKKVSSLISGNYFGFNKKWDINNDNFTDVTLQNRIAIFSKTQFKHQNESSNIAFRYLYEDRNGGEMNWNNKLRGSDSIYGESIYTNRFEMFGSSPLKFGGNKFQLQYSFITHDQNSAYGKTLFKANQIIAFSQLIKHFEFNRHDLVSGLSFRYTYYDDNTIITQHGDSLTITNQPSITSLPGIFVQDEFKINENNSILSGIRFDYNSIHGVILSPRVNWKGTLRKKHIFRLGFGNGYRVVNLFSEDHAAFNGARKVEILSDLKPERSWNLNMNYNVSKKKGDIMIDLDFNAFYNYFSNKIVADYFTDNEKVIFDNLNGYGICRGAGAHLLFGFNFPVKLTMGATFSDVYTMSKDTFGVLQKARQVQAPKLTSNFVLTYIACKINTTFDLSGNVYSPMLLPVLTDDYRPEESPWFGLINFQITTVVGKGWQAYGGVKNLLNFIPSEDPIMRPFDPFDKEINVNNPSNYTFDTGYNYAPYQKRRFFIGLKYQLK